MNFRSRRAALLCLPVILATAGCAGTSIESDLVLEADAGAVIQLHGRAESLDLVNESDTCVRVRVIDRKDNVISNLPLGANDRVLLDLDPAYTIEFDNQSRSRAVLRWIMRHEDTIEYSLAMTPGTH